MKALGKFGRLSVLVAGLLAVSLLAHASGVTISGGEHDTASDYIANGIATRVSRLADGVTMKAVSSDEADFSVISASGLSGAGAAVRVVSYLYTTQPETTGESDEAPARGEAVFLVAGEKVPADTVHRVLTVVFAEEGLAYLAKVATITSSLQVKDGLKGVTTPIHPGAERFWREQSLPTTPGLVPAAPKPAPAKQ